MILDDNAKRILCAFKAAGYEAYAVGGCVRDYFLGVSGGDTDIAVSAPPPVTENILAENGFKAVETGIKHGTVTAVLGSESYEITTFRADGDYDDCRHPRSVSFVRDIESDLARRDFTVNAMAYSPEKGFVDPFGGRADIRNRLIRAVGDPDKRFCEDALRIMRALRFSSTLGFDIEPQTQMALLSRCCLLENISRERIYTELLKLLCGKNAFAVLVKYKSVICAAVPQLAAAVGCEQNTPWHCMDVYCHIAKAVSFAPAEPELRLAMLLHDIGKPLVKRTDEGGRDHFKNHAAVGAELAKEVLRGFHASNKTTERVVTLVKYHQSIEDVGTVSVPRWFNRIGAQNTLDLFRVRLADLKAHNMEKDGVRREISAMESLIADAERLIAEKAPYRVSDLAVNGNDITALGCSGREVGKVLNHLLDLVISGKIENSREALLGYLKDNITASNSFIV